MSNNLFFFLFQGFYRVNYNLNNWNLLINQLKNDPKSIPNINRAQLIADSFNLARAGELPYTVPFNLIDYLYKEDDFIPWYSVKNGMSYLVERLRRCPHTGPQMKVILIFNYILLTIYHTFLNIVLYFYDKN